MKPISASLHGYLDYATVILFILAPALLGFEGLPAAISRTLAIVHLAVTLISDFPLGAYRRLPFPVHGMIERMVGPALVALPFVFGFPDTGAARGFFVLTGLGIFLVSWLTNYRTTVD
jgi:cytochrome c oxidase assembly factor CtaG